MELIYLWVKDYKNIKKQGFNFSPKFNCNYNHETKEVIINKNENYQSIFPDDINITAIVGENGSGKSSILELMIMIQDKNLDFSINGFMILELLGKIRIIKTPNFKDLTEIIEINAHSINDKRFLESINIPFIWMNALNTNNITKNKKLQVAIQINTPSYKFGSNEVFRKHLKINEQGIDLNEILDYKYYFDSFFLQIKPINIDYANYWKDRDENTDYELFSFIKEIDKKQSQYKFNNINDVLLNNYYISYLRFYLSRWTEITSLVPQKNFSKNIISFIKNIKDEFNFNNITENIDNLNKYILHHSKGKNKKLSKLIENTLQSTIFISFNILKSKIDIFNKNLTLKNFTNEILLIKALEDFCFNKELEEFNFISIKLINSKNQVTYDSLSNGEKQLLDTSLDLIYTLTYKTSYKHQIILFDEVDAYLHPIWSKELINSFLNIISKCSSKINSKLHLHLVFTSHSPFILSDLQKENIIFLKDGKQEKPFKDNEQTFGANIHTLLSHGFFMENGLMGEFAKDKIQSVINFLNNKESNIKSKEEALKIIQIIGEPFLKYKLEEQFHEKFSSKQIKNEAKIKRLEEEIERLKNVKPKD